MALAIVIMDAVPKSVESLAPIVPRRDFVKFIVISPYAMPPGISSLRARSLASRQKQNRAVRLRRCSASPPLGSRSKAHSPERHSVVPPAQDTPHGFQSYDFMPDRCQFVQGAPAGWRGPAGGAPTPVGVHRILEAVGLWLIPTFKCRK